MDPQEIKKERRTFHWVRWAILLAILVVSTTIGLLHQHAPELRLVGVDALCPFGGVETLWQLLAYGGYLKRIEVGSVVLLLGAVGTTFLFGRAFCGHFCPLGTLQEIFGSLRSRLGMKRREIPAAVDVPARFLKYAVLGVFTWLAWRTASLVIRPYDPWVAYHHLTSAELLTNFGIGFAILAVSLVGSFVYDRFFCKYLCPMGAFLGLFSKLGMYRPVRHADACIDCGACTKACPVNIDVAVAPSEVRDSECIACGLCVASCPKPEALRYENRQGTFVKPVMLAGATFGIFALVVGASVAAGDMRFSKEPLLNQLEQEADAAYGQGQGEGTGQGQVPLAEQAVPGAVVDVTLIKGYMTMREVSEATGIPAEEFIATFGIQQAEFDLPLKEFKNYYNWDTQAVRDFVADRTGSPRSAPEGCE